MAPTADFFETVFGEQLLVAAIGVGVDVALVICQVLQRPAFAPVEGKIIGGQPWSGIPPNVHPKAGLSRFAAAVFEQWNDRVDGKQHLGAQHRLFQFLSQRPYGFGRR